VRDTIAYAEQMNKALCVLALDFKNAFDRLSHEYLYTILNHYGLDNGFVDCIRRLYTDATSSVKVNGRLHGPFPIPSGVRQGCPLSMVLYTLDLHPSLRLLEQQHPGISVGRSTPVSVVAYADEVTLFLTSAADFQIVENALRLFAQASGDRVNSQKSTFLPVGPWRTFDTIRGIEYRHKV
jgi:hypothetical protein